ncbi:hypothetical protein GCM10009753_52790 [Streptantibioticus ferralitis]
MVTAAGAAVTEELMLRGLALQALEQRWGSRAAVAVTALFFGVAHLAGPDAETPPKVLVVTTFNVDAYVYDALKAGASGFLLKDSPPAELVAAIRTVARGESLLAPAVTRPLIGHFAERLRPADASRPAREEITRALTRRELEVHQLIAEGLSNAEIATALFIAPETVKTYVSRILTKLGLRDRVQAIVLAYRAGLVPGPV